MRSSIQSERIFERNRNGMRRLLSIYLYFLLFNITISYFRRYESTSWQRNAECHKMILFPVWHLLEKGSFLLTFIRFYWFVQFPNSIWFIFWLWLYAIGFDRLHSWIAGFFNDVDHIGAHLFAVICYRRESCKYYYNVSQSIEHFRMIFNGFVENKAFSPFDVYRRIHFE